MTYRFDPRHGQMLLAAAGAYRGAIDGDVGPMTRAAVEASERESGSELGYKWAWSRRLVAATQRQLARTGYAPGPVDGLYGHNTHEALTGWLSHRSGTSANVPRPPAQVPAEAATWPKQAQAAAVFGPAGGPACTAGKCELPMPFALAWAPDQKISRFSCHEKVAAPLTGIFRDAVAHYGAATFSEMRLDRFGGCYNFRPMRGGSALSMHSWGIAVDLDPENNQLRWGKDRALFATPAYDAWWRIVEAAGAVSLGRAANFDWMHFQFARP